MVTQIMSLTNVAFFGLAGASLKLVRAACVRGRQRCATVELGSVGCTWMCTHGRAQQTAKCYNTQVPCLL